MKNVHVLPTDKPSRLFIDDGNQEECFGSYGYGIHEDITKGEEYYNVKFNK